ncbi:VOC family protein [Undibacterium sp.]|uniref:VOC family protein n=1 Tax=Undibacterium sp. TaxID=1914977 RepID=UPI00374CE63C
MSATLRHFAINADDVGRAKTFYESVFGWRFDAWGPPGFYQIKNAGKGLLGALQERRELAPGVRIAGYEASMGVTDLRATMAAVEAGGGRIVMRPFRIEGVGELIYFEDTEGNLVGAMQYAPDFVFP